jgi:hypothetical protein
VRLVESYLSLDVGKLNRAGFFEPGAVRWWGWLDADGEETASLAIATESRQRILLLYRPTSGYVGDIACDARDKADLHRGDHSWIVYPLWVTWTPCNYGGSRPWLHCPNRGCGRRVAKLYLGNIYFACPRCYRLAYTSQTERRRERLQRRQDKLLRRLDSDESCLNKPKGMHRTTFERLVDEVDELDMAIDEEVYASTLRLIARYGR